MHPTPTRTLGILGGMAWPSTAEAYRRINEEVGRRLGGTHSASLLILSYDFAEVERLQSAGRWDDAGALLADGARRLAGAGADGLLLCTNTMHRVAPAIEAAVDVPLLHIADVTAAAVRTAGLDRVALLGTRFTMEDGFYVDRLRGHGVATLVPGSAGRRVVHSVIYDELVRGVVTERGRERVLEVVEALVDDGAEGVIAGCTELELLLGPDDLPVPWFPTTELQATSAVDWLLEAAE